MLLTVVLLAPALPSAIASHTGNPDGWRQTASDPARDTYNGAMPFNAWLIRPTFQVCGQVLYEEVVDGFDRPFQHEDATVLITSMGAVANTLADSRIVYPNATGTYNVSILNPVYLQDTFLSSLAPVEEDQPAYTVTIYPNGVTFSPASQSEAGQISQDPDTLPQESAFHEVVTYGEAQARHTACTAPGGQAPEQPILDGPTAGYMVLEYEDAHRNDRAFYQDEDDGEEAYLTLKDPADRPDPVEDNSLEDSFVDLAWGPLGDEIQDGSADYWTREPVGDDNRVIFRSPLSAVTSNEAATPLEVDHVDDGQLYDLSDPVALVTPAQGGVQTTAEEFDRKTNTLTISVADGVTGDPLDDVPVTISHSEVLLGEAKQPALTNTTGGDGPGITTFEVPWVNETFDGSDINVEASLDGYLTTQDTCSSEPDRVGVGWSCQIVLLPKPEPITVELGGVDLEPLDVAVDVTLEHAIDDEAQGTIHFDPGQATAESDPLLPGPYRVTIEPASTYATVTGTLQHPATDPDHTRFLVPTAGTSIVLANLTDGTAPAYGTSEELVLGGDVGTLTAACGTGDSATGMWVEDTHDEVRQLATFEVPAGAESCTVQHQASSVWAANQTTAALDGSSGPTLVNLSLPRANKTVFVDVDPIDIDGDPSIRLERHGANFTCAVNHTGNNTCETHLPWDDTNQLNVTAFGPNAAGDALFSGSIAPVIDRTLRLPGFPVDPTEIAPVGVQVNLTDPLDPDGELSERGGEINVTARVDDPTVTREICFDDPQVVDTGPQTCTDGTAWKHIPAGQMDANITVPSGVKVQINTTELATHPLYAHTSRHGVYGPTPNFEDVPLSRGESELEIGAQDAHDNEPVEGLFVHLVPSDQPPFDQVDDLTVTGASDEAIASIPWGVPYTLEVSDQADDYAFNSKETDVSLTDHKNGNPRTETLSLARNATETLTIPIRAPSPIEGTSDIVVQVDTDRYTADVNGDETNSPHPATAGDSSIELADDLTSVDNVHTVRHQLDCRVDEPGGDHADAGKKNDNDCLALAEEKATILKTWANVTVEVPWNGDGQDQGSVVPYWVKVHDRNSSKTGIHGSGWFRMASDGGPSDCQSHANCYVDGQAPTIDLVADTYPLKVDLVAQPDDIIQACIWDPASTQGNPGDPGAYAGTARGPTRVACANTTTQDTDTAWFLGDDRIPYNKENTKDGDATTDGHTVDVRNTTRDERQHYAILAGNAEDPLQILLSEQAWLGNASVGPDGSAYAVASNRSALSGQLVPGTDGELVGTVTDAVSGDPIQDAVVLAVPSSPDTGAATKAAVATGNLGPLPTPFSDLTDAQGTYTIEDVPKGAYTLVVLHPLYQEKTREDVTVAGGTVTEDFELEPRAGAGAMTGTVTDQAGDPVNEAQVVAQLSQPSTDEGVAMPSTQPIGPTFNATTDADGRYTFDHLPPGIYTVNAVKPGYEVDEHEGVNVQAYESTEVDPIELLVGGQLTGQVHHEGEPAEAQVVLVPISPDTERRWFPDDPFTGVSDGSTGEYRIEGVSPGEYHLLAITRDGSTLVGQATAKIDSGPNTKDIEMLAQEDVATEGSASLSGHVYAGSTTNPAAGAVLIAQPTEPDQEPPAETPGADQASPLFVTLANQEGAFEIDHLPAGTYQLRATGVSLAALPAETDVYHPGTAGPFTLDQGEDMGGIEIILANTPIP